MKVKDGDGDGRWMPSSLCLTLPRAIERHANNNNATFPPASSASGVGVKSSQSIILFCSPFLSFSDLTPSPPLAKLLEWTGGLHRSPRP